MAVLAQDLKFGLRGLVKNPVFTVASVLALALGIGANSAVFSVIDAVLLRPLPYTESNRLVKIWEKRTQLAKGAISFADFRDWKDQNQVFEQVAAYQTGDYNLTGGDEPEQIQGVAVSSNLFALLRAQPSLGNTFPEREENQGSNSEVILGHDIWVNRFAADRSIIGKSISVENKNYVVVGVMSDDGPRLTLSISTVARSTLGAAGFRRETPKAISETTRDVCGTVSIIRCIAIAGLRHFFRALPEWYSPRVDLSLSSVSRTDVQSTSFRLRV
jgi:hypothetical protein